MISVLCQKLHSLACTHVSIGGTSQQGPQDRATLRIPIVRVCFTSRLQLPPQSNKGTVQRHRSGRTNSTSSTKRPQSPVGESLRYRTVAQFPYSCRKEKNISTPTQRSIHQSSPAWMPAVSTQLHGTEANSGGRVLQRFTKATHPSATKSLGGNEEAAHQRALHFPGKQSEEAQGCVNFTPPQG